MCVWCGCTRICKFMLMMVTNHDAQTKLNLLKALVIMFAPDECAICSREMPAVARMATSMYAVSEQLQTQVAARQTLRTTTSIPCCPNRRDYRAHCFILCDRRQTACTHAIFAILSAGTTHTRVPLLQIHLLLRRNGWQHLPNGRYPRHDVEFLLVRQLP